MLSDEEKQAIDELWHFDCAYNREIKIVLNLIEKQSKEIEELKKPKYLLNAKTGEITTINNSEFISKDKIKAKIEELEGQEDWYIENKSLDDLYGRIDELKELLEEE